MHFCRKLGKLLFLLIISMLTLESRIYTLLLPPILSFDLECAFLQKITGDINTFVLDHYPQLCRRKYLWRFVMQKGEVILCFSKCFVLRQRPHLILGKIYPTMHRQVGWGEWGSGTLFGPGFRGPNFFTPENGEGGNFRTVKKWGGADTFFSEKC